MSIMTLSDHGALPWQWGAVLGATLAAAALDLQSRRIPNWLTGPCLLGGLAHAAWVSGVGGLVEGAAAAVVVALPTLVAYIEGHGGAGDAKLMAAVGAWLGLLQGLVVTAAVALSGLALACGILVARRARRDRSEARYGSKPLGIPYGVAIFSGSLISALGIWAWYA